MSLRRQSIAPIHTVLLAGLAWGVGACSSSPLGPDISGREYPEENAATDGGGGVTTGDQPDDGGDDSLGADAGETGPSCSDASTRHYWYPGATLSHAIACDEEISTLEDEATNWPSYLS